MSERVINVQGMTCNHCKMAVTRAVSALKGVSRVEVSLERNTVTVSYDEKALSLDSVARAIEGQGYQVSSS